MEEELKKLRSEVTKLQSKLKREQLANKELATRLLQSRDAPIASSSIVANVLPTTATSMVRTTTSPTVNLEEKSLEQSPLSMVAESLLVSPSNTTIGRIAPREAAALQRRSRRNSSVSSGASENSSIPPYSVNENNHHHHHHHLALASVRRILALILTERMHPYEAIRSEATLYGLTDDTKQLLLSIGMLDQGKSNNASSKSITTINKSAAYDYTLFLPYSLPSFIRTVPLTDMFLIIGPPTVIIIESLQKHWKLLQNGQAGIHGPPIMGEILDENVDTEVLYRYPPEIIDPGSTNSSSTHIPLPSNTLPDFAYPVGANLRALNLFHAATACGFNDKQVKQGVEWPFELQDAFFGKHGLRRGPRTHMFTLNGSDAEDREVSSTIVGTSLSNAAGQTVPSRTRYCLCVTFTEPVSHSILGNTKTMKRRNSQVRTEASLSRRNSVEALASKIPRSSSKTESKDNSHSTGKYQTDASVLLIPRVMCIVSRFPFFSLHYEILRYAVILWRASMLQKLKQAHQLGYISFAQPPPSDTHTVRKSVVRRNSAVHVAKDNVRPEPKVSDTVRSSSVQRSNGTIKMTNESIDAFHSSSVSLSSVPTSVIETNKTNSIEVPNKILNAKEIVNPSDIINGGKVSSIASINSYPSASSILNAPTATIGITGATTNPSSVASSSTLWNGLKQFYFPKVGAGEATNKSDTLTNMNDSTSSLSTVSRKGSVTYNNGLPVSSETAVVDSIVTDTLSDPLSNVSPVIPTQSMQNFVIMDTDNAKSRNDTPIVNVDIAPPTAGGGIRALMNMFHPETSNLGNNVTTVSNSANTVNPSSTLIVSNPLANETITANKNSKTTVLPSFLSPTAASIHTTEKHRTSRYSLDLGDDVIMIDEKPNHTHHSSNPSSVLRLFTETLTTTNPNNTTNQRSSRSSSINSGSLDEATDSDNDADTYPNNNGIYRKPSNIRNNPSSTETTETTEANPMLDVDHLAEITSVLGTSVVCPSVVDIIHRYFLVNVPPPGETVRILLPGTLTTATAFLPPTVSRGSLFTSFTNDYDSSTNNQNNHGLPWSADKPPYITFTRTTLKEWKFHNKYTPIATLPQVYELTKLETYVLNTIQDIEMNSVAEVPMGRIQKIQETSSVPKSSNDTIVSSPIHSWAYGRDIDHPETVANLVGWAVPVLFSLLPVDSILLLIGAALTEHKIIFVGGNLSQESVSACVLALPSLLRPLSWIGPFLPIVPSNLSDILAAPIPILVGVATLPDNFEQDESTVIVLLDRQTVRIPTIRHRGLQNSASPADANNSSHDNSNNMNSNEFSSSRFRMTTYSSSFSTASRTLLSPVNLRTNNAISSKNNNGDGGSSPSESSTTYSSPSQDVILPRFLDIQLPGNSLLFHELEPLSQIIRNSDPESMNSPRPSIFNDDNGNSQRSNGGMETIPNNSSGTGGPNRSETPSSMIAGTSSASLLSKPVIVPHLYPRPCYKPTKAQNEAVEQIVTIINHHIRSLLARSLAAGLFDDHIKEYISNNESTVVPLRYLPSTSSCKHHLLGKVPEVEEPFWACLLSSQMFSVYRDTISLRLCLKVGEEEVGVLNQSTNIENQQNSINLGSVENFENSNDRSETVSSLPTEREGKDTLPVLPPPVPGSIDKPPSNAVVNSSRSAPRLARRGKPISLRQIMLGPTNVTDAVHDVVLTKNSTVPANIVKNVSATGGIVFSPGNSSVLKNTDTAET